MVQTIQEAHSPVSIKDAILRMIVRQEIPPMFIRRHLNRERLIGWIGDRGGGKSFGCAVAAIVDGLLDGVPVYSNIYISVDVTVDDETAQKYGLKTGGTVHYEAEELDKDALLDIDNQKYKNCIIVIEEINIQYSNVRRFMSNTNVDFNEVCQQLRHNGASLYYNVIDEMFIDPQLRGLTDVFIKTYDTAFDLDSLAAKKPTGIDFKWSIYPMTGYIAGEQKKYSVTKKPLPPAYFHAKKWQGVYNTFANQKKGVYSKSRIESTKEMDDYNDKWGYIGQSLINLYDSGVSEIWDAELYEYLDIDPEDEKEAAAVLKNNYRIKQKYSAGKRIYLLPNRVIKKEREKVLALN